MKYYWIFKYILHNAFTKKNLVSSYYEGGVFGIYFMCPILSWGLINGHVEKGLVVVWGILTIIIDEIISWNDDKVERIYIRIAAKRKELNKEFKIVKWSIFLNFFIFFLSVVYRVLI